MNGILCNYNRALVLACMLFLACGSALAQVKPVYPCDEKWVASWIWGYEKKHGPLGCFRKEITLHSGLKSAWAQTSGDDGFTLIINGKEVFTGGFWWKTINRVDLTPFLKEGINVLAARVRNYAHPGGFLMQIDVAYQNDDYQLIKTDETWRFSGRETSKDWLAPGYDDSGWEQCLSMGSPPDASPWGELPLEYLGPRFPVELVAKSFPSKVTAGSVLPLALSLKLTKNLPSNTPVVVVLRSDNTTILTTSVKANQVGNTVKVHIPLRISPYAPGGLFRLEAGLQKSRYTNPNITGFHIGDVVVEPRTKPGTLTETRVKQYNGAPTLFINGKPRFALWFYQMHPSRQDAKAFHKAGIDVFTFDVPLGWTGPFKHDYADMDDTIGRLLDANPNAYIVPRLWLQAPGWWLDAHPTEAVKMADGTGWIDNGLGGTKHESFASELWRKEMSETLRRLIEHVMASPYSDRVIGYHIGNGIYTEWHAWSAVNYPDISEPMRIHFVNYVRRKYENDPNRLRAAWGQSSITFDTIQCPSLKDRTTGDTGIFRNPAKSRYVSDYYEAFHLATAQAIETFCKVVKEETHGKLIALAFYGYWPDLDWPSEGDHRALNYLLNSPTIDCFASPHSYARRGLGEDGLFRNHPASLQLHGKLFLDEGDDRTSLANDPEFTHVKTIAESVSVLRRAFGNTLTHNVGMWYMDQQGNWFHDPALMEEMARASKWGEKSLNLPRKMTSQIAVIVAPQSDFYMTGRSSGLDHISMPLFVDQIGSLCRSGAPFDIYLVDDLANTKMPDYKVYIMLECFYLTDYQRYIIEKKVMRPGNTAVWFYAPGYVTDNGLSTKAMSDLTGITLSCEAAGGKLEMKAVEGGAVFGVDKLQAPAFTCTDLAATKLAEYTDGRGVGMAERLVKGCRSIYVGSPAVPPGILRSIYKRAGIHVYLNSDDPFTANESFLSIHTATGGNKSISLPEAKSVYDVMAGRYIGSNTKRFTVDIPQYETRLYWLAAVRK